MRHVLAFFHRIWSSPTTQATYSWYLDNGYLGGAGTIFLTGVLNGVLKIKDNIIDF